VAGNRKFVGEVGRHLTFLALTDNLARAVKLFEKHLAWALETRDLITRFDFYLAARFLLERLADAGEEAVKLRLPASFPARQEGGRYEAAALAGWFEEALAEVAGRFDARNGNDGFARRLREARGWKKWVTPFPLK
jgi:plasmid replication initiation protein